MLCAHSDLWSDEVNQVSRAVWMPINPIFDLTRIMRLAEFLPSMAGTPIQTTEIERFFVKSRQMKSLGYDPAQEILQVEFNNGLIYEAKGVAAFEFDELMQSNDFDFVFSQGLLERHNFERIGRTSPLF